MYYVVTCHQSGCVLYSVASLRINRSARDGPPVFPLVLFIFMVEIQQVATLYRGKNDSTGCCENSLHRDRSSYNFLPLCDTWHNSCAVWALTPSMLSPAGWTYRPDKLFKKRLGENSPLVTLKHFMEVLQ